MTTNVATQLFDAGVRIERTIWLDGAVCADTASDDFEDAFEDLSDERRDSMFPELPADFDGKADEALKYLYAARGFLIQAASPVRTYAPGSTSYDSGWGHYRTKWFRVSDPESAVSLIIAWEEELGEKDRAKADAKATATPA